MMPRYLFTVKVGRESLSVVVRDSDTGGTGSATLVPKELWEPIIRDLGKRPEVEIKWE